MLLLPDIRREIAQNLVRVSDQKMRREKCTQQADVGFEHLNGWIFIEMNDVDDALNGKFKFTVISYDGERWQRVNQSKAIVS